MVAQVGDAKRGNVGKVGGKRPPQGPPNMPREVGETTGQLKKVQHIYNSLPQVFMFS